MHRIRYFWIGLCLFLSLRYLRELQAQFTWEYLSLMLGWVLLGFVAVVNAKLVWPYEVKTDYQPKVNDSLSRCLQVFGMVFVIVGGVSNLYF